MLYRVARVRWPFFHGVLLACGLLSAQLSAQDPDYFFHITDGADDGTGSATVSVLFDNTGDGVQGWAYGVCHDTDILSIESIADGGTTANLSFTFLANAEVPAGVTQAALMDVFTGATLDASVDNELLAIQYSIDGPGAALETDLDFCEIGAPITTIVVVVDNQEVEPETEGGAIVLTVNSVTFTYSVASAFVGFDAGTGEASFTVGATIEEHADSPGNPNDTFGFSMAIAHDPELLAATAVEPAAILDGLNDGDGPEFFGVEILEDGITLGVVHAFDDATEVLTFADAEEVVTIEYSTNAANLIDAPDPVASRLEFTDALGDPAVVNTTVITADGDTANAAGFDGTITLLPGGPFLVRGDCNSSGAYSIGDPIALLGSLFSRTGPVACADACDADDDGGLDLIDALRMLEHLFLSGAAPEHPYPDCGADGTADSLGCEDDEPCR